MNRMYHLGLGLLLMFLAGLALRAAPNPAPFPSPASKKGLQVQIANDALALGIKHAGLNFNLAQLVDPRGDTNNPAWHFAGRTYRFQRGYLEQLDREIKTLSDHGVVVSLILLNYEGSDPELRRLLLHPGYDKTCPNHLSAFNTVTPEGRAWFSASLEFLADRWSRPDQKFGRVWNWIVGNEVNSHWFWANMGPVTMEEFADDYLRTVRLTHAAIRKASANARVYLSLEHHWNLRYPGGTATQAFPARPFLDYFNLRAKTDGDFDWHVAFHPYPENLFEPRTWNDKSARPDWNTTPRITFKNLDQLNTYLAQPELLHDYRPRHVILSEQGFHTPKGADGEKIQAAAYCYAWKQVERLPGIDSFILHRHVDHAHEGGLLLGLWTHKPGTIADPDRKKLSYEIFRLADTPEWEPAFRFALPIIGLTNWTELAQ
jgi:hypothetical protein